MLCASMVFCQRDAARTICITRISRLEKNVSTFPSYTIATALAASNHDLGQNVPEVMRGVATNGNEWAMTVRSAA